MSAGALVFAITDHGIIVAFIVIATLDLHPVAVMSGGHVTAIVGQLATATLEHADIAYVILEPQDRRMFSNNE